MIAMKSRVPGHIYEICRRLRQKQTSPEKILWECLRAKRLNGLKFRRQHPIGRYIADFYCPEAGLTIELDGAVHHLKDQRDYDQIRQDVIETRELRVVRIRNEEIKQDLEPVLREILLLTSPPVSPSPLCGEGD